MTKTEQVKALLQGIQQDRQRYIELLALLDQQRDVMISRKAEELSGINQLLEAYYQNLERSATERNTLLKALEISPDTQGMTNLFAKLPVTHQKKAHALWADLEHYANACSSLNERNGLLLNMQIEILQPLLQDPEPSFLYTR